MERRECKEGLSENVLYSNDREVYKKFLKLLQNYQEDQKSVKEVHDRVKELFKGHPDLLIEFKQFLPDPPDPTTDAGQAANRSRKQQPASKKQRTGEHGREDKVPSDLKYKVCCGRLFSIFLIWNTLHTLVSPALFHQVDL